MKKILLTTAMVIGAFLFMNETKAQVRLGLNINIGARPNWGLTGNYTGDYYYFPEIDTYYDIPNRQFIYLDNDQWVFASELPYAYRDYDLYNGYKVVVNESRPYLHADVYRNRYINYYNTYHNRRTEVVAQRGGYTNRFDNNHFDNRYEQRGRIDERGRFDEHFNNREAEHNTIKEIQHGDIREAEHGNIKQAEHGSTREAQRNDHFNNNKEAEHTDHNDHNDHGRNQDRRGK